MFGYVRIYKDEMKVREFNLFKAHYCGLCKTLKKEYGFASRMGLSYDVTFLAVLLAAVSEKKPVVCPQRCIANPFLKKPVVNTEDYFEYTASVNVILTYLKLADDLRDNHSMKALFASLLLLPAKRKARKRHPVLFFKVKEHIDKLTQLEKAQCADIDILANEFGMIMKHVFSAELIKSDAERRIFEHIGYSLGRFIYILDAYEDREKDKKEKNFNPFLLQNKPVNANDIKMSLTFTLSDVSNSYQLLNLNRNKPILDNIIYLGLLDVLDKTMGQSSKDSQKEKH